MRRKNVLFRRLEPIAREGRDPESAVIVETGVRYVKRNALTSVL